MEKQEQLVELQEMEFDSSRSGEVAIDMSTFDTIDHLELFNQCFPGIDFKRQTETIRAVLNSMSAKDFTRLVGKVAQYQNIDKQEKMVFATVAHVEHNKVTQLSNANELLNTIIKRERKYLFGGTLSLGVLLVYSFVISLQYFL